MATRLTVFPNAEWRLALLPLLLATAKLGYATESATADDIAALKKRIEKLEQQEQAEQEALASDRLSEREPELVTRLKALEMNTGSLKQAARRIDAIGEVEAGIDLLYVSQWWRADDADSRYDNYRFDAALSVPAGESGRASGSLFFHVRAGQSPAPDELPSSFSGLNATAFQLGGTSQPEDAALTLTEAWYQFDMPLTGGKSRHHLQANIGKIDPFVFFDQNAGANDEASQFLAAPLVHNALLDNPMAAQIGTDAYGSTPGLRLAYRYDLGNEQWQVSYGHFAAGEDANFGSARNESLQLLQLEWNTRFWGQAGNYRLYRFENEAGPTFIADQQAAQRGWAISADQKLGSDWLAFARYSRGQGQNLPFDRALAVGVEWNGDWWSRASDKLGLGYAKLHSSRDFRDQAATLPDYAYLPSAAESLLELYYRYHFNGNCQLSLHWQRVADAAANPAQDDQDVFSLRLLWSY